MDSHTMKLSYPGSLTLEWLPNIHGLLWTTILGVTVVLFYQLTKTPPFPAINAYPWDFTRRKAYAAYNNNARELVAEGFAKYNGAFCILTPNGPKVILPSTLTDWVKNCKDLDHQALVHEDFFADYPGFEGQAVVTNPDRILIDVVRIKLSQNANSITLMDSQMPQILSETWTDNKDWHTLNWSEDTMKLISRMSASIFTGPKLAENEQWQKLTITYTVNIFAAVNALRQWPGFLRRAITRFLPQTKKCQEQVQDARKMIRATLDERAAERSAAMAAGRTLAVYEDAIAWADEAAAGRPIDLAAFQLALAISALHTTSEALRQVLLDLCLHRDLLEPLRDEIRTVIAEDGMSIASLFKMQLLDSVMKESQRFKSASVGIERKVIRDTTLPDGTTLPRGTSIAVDSSDMWSANTHENPELFDGYRFLRIRQAGGKGSSTAAFASSHKEHNTFGAGRFICPGRFFVANEMKIALAHVLLKYDLRLQAGQEVRDLRAGFYGMSDLEAKVEVRRRE